TALDHDLPRVVVRLSNERDFAIRAISVRRRSMRNRPHPLCTEPGLARTAPAQHQPRCPSPTVCKFAMLLMWESEYGKDAIAAELGREKLLLQVAPRQSGFAQKLQCGAQVRDGIHQCPGACRRNRRRRRLAGRVSASAAP